MDPGRQPAARVCRALRGTLGIGVVGSGGLQAALAAHPPLWYATPPGLVWGSRDPGRLRRRSLLSFEKPWASVATRMSAPFSAGA